MSGESDELEIPPFRNSNILNFRESSSNSDDHRGLPERLMDLKRGDHLE